jgi:hypothetical protein
VPPFHNREGLGFRIHVEFLSIEPPRLRHLMAREDAIRFLNRSFVISENLNVASDPIYKLLGFREDSLEKIVG